VSAADTLWGLAMADAGRYKRYQIETKSASDIVEWPSPFTVNVNRLRLAQLILKETIHYRGDLEVVLNRPCVYGVFSAPLGGFTPRERLCVGCLRCTVQHPELVTIRHNPEFKGLGDSYYGSTEVGAIAYEASTGRVPVRGAGYRGKFGGEGWDGIWTDMSEIVRPTRDGIHGREFISTVVDIGRKPQYIEFNAAGMPVGQVPDCFSLPIPIILDRPPDSAASGKLTTILSQVASETDTLAVVPCKEVIARALSGDHIVPLVEESEVSLLERLPNDYRLIEVATSRLDVALQARAARPEAQVAIRLDFDSADSILELAEHGFGVFHLIADYHGFCPDGRFVFDGLLEVHQSLLAAAIRDEVTLIVSGGIAAADHVAKAIIGGADVVALDIPCLVAMQARFDGEVVSVENGRCLLPAELNTHWGATRVMNLVAAWRDQLLEIMGAMGLREVRRLRGELGRALFQRDLEEVAFGGIEGFDD